MAKVAPSGDTKEDVSSSARSSFGVVIKTTHPAPLPATAYDPPEKHEESERPSRVMCSHHSSVASTVIMGGATSTLTVGSSRFSGRSDPNARHSVGSLVHAAEREWRLFLSWSGWYDSRLALTLRRFIRGKTFAIVTMVALFVALFFADLFIVCQVTTNTISDTVLTIVFAIFLLEFLGLTITDASYILSFFFWMDLLGTVSMIFDISFLLGTSAVEPEKYSGQRGEENLIVVRAARATKLGARAGRLSRVMKLLRFLPFFNGAGDSDVKMARVISHQLTNVLSTRVAFLTVCLVVLLPIFGMFTYPEVDDSMSAWTQLLAENIEEVYSATYLHHNATRLSDARRRLQIELDRFSKFYESVSYGPFEICYGNKIGNDGDFQCLDTLPAQPTLMGYAYTFRTTFTEPSRKGSIRLISEKRLQTFYDLSSPLQFESLANVGLIIFVILVMVVFGLVTSTSISAIALQPLERMLSVVRERCQQIFKYTNDLADEEVSDEEEEYDDTEQSSEFELLEKVVAKLAAIAHLSATTDEPELKEGMTENEVMVLNWMQGTPTVVAHHRSPSKTSQSPAHRYSERNGHIAGSSNLPQADGSETAEQAEDVHGSKSIISSTLKSIPAEIIDELESPNFNSLDLAQEMNIAVGVYIVQSFEGSSIWVNNNVQEIHIHSFVKSCESRYNANPFHSFAHALDVEYSTFRAMRLIEAHHFLPESSQFWLLIASIAHDLGHIAVNNQYLIEISHELALKYNDRSPLENMHCATLFQVVSDPEANVFAEVDRDLYKEIRKGIINAILHTDVTKHNDMMKELALLYQMNSEAFEISHHSGNLHPQVLEVLQSHTSLVVNALLHSSDVGNPMKPWLLAERYAYLCLDEFFAQGDLEKAAGIPVQMLNDREKVNRPNSQIGFIEFVIAPMVEAVVRLFPPLDGLAENLGFNIECWFEVWEKEANPPAEAMAKTQARVHKVIARCFAVKRNEPQGHSHHGSVINE